MGRSVICNDNLVEFLEYISTNIGSGFTCGLIVGQFAGQKDYVIHLPRIPLISEDGESADSSMVASNTFSKLADINENVVSEHARSVTRMLPGGMWVLGFYIVGPGDIFSDKNSINKLRAIAHAIHNCTKGNDFMCGKDPSNQKLILHFNSLSKKFLCKSLDMNTLNSSIRPADWKFKPDCTDWFRIECNFNLNSLNSVLLSNNKLSTKKKFQEVLSKFQEHLETLIYFINNEFSPGDNKLSSIEKNEQVEGEENVFQLSFYECKETYNKSEYATKQDRSDKVVSLGGVIVSRVFLNGKATVDDACKAVKEDLLRSLSSRFEMHWQSFDEPTETNEPLVRLPPRRIIFTPPDSEISFCEYIFEGENESDALATISENLGFMDGETLALEREWVIPDIFNYTRQDANSKSSVEETNNAGKQQVKTPASETNKTLLFGIITAGIILILSLIIHILN